MPQGNVLRVVASNDRPQVKASAPVGQRGFSVVTSPVVARLAERLTKSSSLPASLTKAPDAKGTMAGPITPQAPKAAPSLITRESRMEQGNRFTLAPAKVGEALARHGERSQPFQATTIIPIRQSEKPSPEKAEPKAATEPGRPHVHLTSSVEDKRPSLVEVALSSEQKTPPISAATVSLPTTDLKTEIREPSSRVVPGDAFPLKQEMTVERHVLPILKSDPDLVPPSEVVRQFKTEAEARYSQEIPSKAGTSDTTGAPPDSERDQSEKIILRDYKKNAEEVTVCKLGHIGCTEDHTLTAAKAPDAPREKTEFSFDAPSAQPAPVADRSPEDLPKDKPQEIKHSSAEPLQEERKEKAILGDYKKNAEEVTVCKLGHIGCTEDHTLTAAKAPDMPREKTGFSFDAQPAQPSQINLPKTESGRQGHAAHAFPKTVNEITCRLGHKGCTETHTLHIPTAPVASREKAATFSFGS
jgi:hypothetical protein